MGCAAALVTFVCSAPRLLLLAHLLCWNNLVKCKKFPNLAKPHSEFQALVKGAGGGEEHCSGSGSRRRACQRTPNQLWGCRRGQTRQIQWSIQPKDTAIDHGQSCVLGRGVTPSWFLLVQEQGGIKINRPLGARQERALRMPRGKGMKPLPSGHHRCHGFARALGATGHFQGGKLHPRPPPMLLPAGEPCLRIPTRQRSAEMPPHLPPALAPFPAHGCWPLQRRMPSASSSGRPRVAVLARLASAAC